MLDIETLSKCHLPTIPQLSAIQFNPITGETFREFNVFINIEDAINKGFRVDGSTLHFWLAQSKEAQNSVFFQHAITVEKAFERFADFIKEISYSDDENSKKGLYNNVSIWGNGPSFDSSKLKNGYTHLNMEIPWTYWNEKCVRTVSNINPRIKKEMPFSGIPHNGLDDCKHQIRYVHIIMSEIYDALQKVNSSLLIKPEKNE